MRACRVLASVLMGLGLLLFTIGVQGLGCKV